MRTPKGFRFISVALIVLGTAAPAFAAEYKIKKNESVFAIVTHKAGLASALAHNHIVNARNYDAKLSFDEGKGTGSFALKFPVTELDVDAPDIQKQWYPQIKKLGLLEAPFGDVPEKDRDEIKEAMFDDSQLDADKFKEISASATSLTKEASTVGGEKFTHKVQVAITVHGKTVEKKVPVAITTSGSEVQMFSVATFRFTEFDIKPYSAFLGAVSNKDEFEFLVSLKAEKL